MRYLSILWHKYLHFRSLNRTFAVEIKNVMAIDSAIFRRSELLLGDETMKRIAQKRVIIFGVGGVGSWCAESLVRSGILKKRLTVSGSTAMIISSTLSIH